MFLCPNCSNFPEKRRNEEGSSARPLFVSSFFGKCRKMSENVVPQNREQSAKSRKSEIYFCFMNGPKRQFYAHRRGDLILNDTTFTLPRAESFSSSIHTKMRVSTKHRSRRATGAFGTAPQRHRRIQRLQVRSHQSNFTTHDVMHAKLHAATHCRLLLHFRTNTPV